MKKKTEKYVSTLTAGPAFMTLSILSPAPAVLYPRHDQRILTDLHAPKGQGEDAILHTETTETQENTETHVIRPK